MLASEDTIYVFNIISALVDYLFMSTVSMMVS